MASLVSFPHSSQSEIVPKVVSISSIGLKDYSVYLAHANGNWGPEKAKSDFLKHKFEVVSDDRLESDVTFLEIGEEFKIVVVLSNKETAAKVVNERKSKGVFDGGKREDDKQNSLWLLSEDFPIVNSGQWNRNNQFVIKA